MPLPETFAEDITLFRGQSQKLPHGRVFGGQVLAQCVVAGGLTVRDVEGGDDRRLHSLHGYFMRPGDDTLPIRFGVEQMRDGNSFSTRRVHAIQNGKPILSMTAPSRRPTGGMDHQDPMPDAPDPMSVPSLADAFPGVDHPGARHIADAAPHRAAARRGQHLPRRRPRAGRRPAVWMRAIGELPDDPLLHAAVLAYASDYSLLEPVLRRHGLVWTDRGCAPRAWTTRCGSTGRPRPTSGCSTPSSRRRRQGGRGLAHRPDVQPRTAPSSPRRPGGHAPRQGRLSA